MAVSTGRRCRPPFITTSFRTEHGTVADVRYRAYGSAPGVAAGSMMAEIIQSRTIEEALAVTERQLAKTVGRLPRWQALAC